MARILIIDDDADNRDVLRARLEPSGHEVHEAVDGEAGLAAAAQLKPTLIILDVMMPHLDGWEVCRRLKANPESQKTPVIMLTACTQSVDSLRGFANGADEYLGKPWSFDQLNALVTKCLGRA